MVHLILLRLGRQCSTATIGLLSVVGEVCLHWGPGVGINESWPAGEM